MSYTTLNKIKIVFRCLVGLVFLFSAYLKVIAINGFEIYVYTVNPFNLNFSFIIHIVHFIQFIFFAIVLATGADAGYNY